MKTTINKLKSSRIEILFEIPWHEFQQFFNKAIDSLSSEAKVAGFRDKNIPASLLEKEIGQEKILWQAAQFAIKEKYSYFVQEKAIEAIGTPKISILKLAKNNPFSFKVVVDVIPEIDLPDYKELAKNVQKKKIKVEDKDIEESLDLLKKSRPKFEQLNREAREGDFVEIEYSSPQIESGKVYYDRFFLGKGGFTKGFEDNIQGMEIGQEKKFVVSFPSDYHKKELASKEAEISLKLKNVQLAKFPEINDEFAKSLGKFKNLTELKESIKQGIIQEREKEEKERIRSEVLDKISSMSEFEVPKTLVDVEIEALMNDLKEKVSNQLKMSFEDYLKNINKTEEQLKESFHKQAEKMTRQFLIIREIGKKEKIEVSDEEAEEAANEFLKKYPSAQKAEKDIDPARLKDYYKGVLFNEKVFQILESASGKENEK